MNNAIFLFLCVGDFSVRAHVAATAKLAQIPLDEQPDIDFYNLFTAIIDDLETNPNPEYDDNGSGKMEQPLPEGIASEMQRDDKTAMNIVAQSVAAQRKGIDYWRTPNYAHAKANQTLNNNALQITPNPANAVVTLSADVAYATDVHIYNCMGQLVQSTTLYDGARQQWQINTRELPNGIYICHLLNGATQVATGKLVLIK